MKLVLTSDLLMQAYAQGIFPMAYSADTPYIQWICPEMRGQLPIKNMHIPRSLKRAVKKSLKNPDVKIKIDTAFDAVISKCAEANENRPETWINHQIMNAFIALHKEGHAHSIEYWENDELQGGLYGLKFGAVFCGESMFSRSTNSSKIALVHLVARLWKGGFKILDTQFVNDHLEQFGIYEIPHAEYLAQIENASNIECDFYLKGVEEKDIVEEYFKMRQGQEINI